MFEEVERILSRFTEEKITESARLSADLCLSSLDVVSIAVEFEEAFDIEIPDRAIQKLITVKDIVE